MRRLIAVMVAACLWPAAPAAADVLADWRPDVAAARRYAQTRAGEVSFAVRTERRAWSWRGAATYRSASLVKAMLLVAYLRRADVRVRALRRGERGLLDPMVRRSDNGAADVVDARVGLPALAALARRAGMRHFVAHPVWGGSTVTAADQARFFLRIDRLVPPRHRAYALELLRGVIPAQRWGIPAAVHAGWRVAFKGGWGEGVTQQVDHQAALLTNGRLRLSVAVLSAGNPTDAYGAATLEGVAARLLRRLPGPLVGRAGTSRAGMPRRERPAVAFAWLPFARTGPLFLLMRAPEPQGCGGEPAARARPPAGARGPCREP